MATKSMRFVWAVFVRCHFSRWNQNEKIVSRTTLNTYLLPCDESNNNNHSNGIGCMKQETEF